MKYATRLRTLDLSRNGSRVSLLLGLAQSHIVVNTARDSKESLFKDISLLLRFLIEKAQQE